MGKETNDCFWYGKLYGSCLNLDADRCLPLCDYSNNQHKCKFYEKEKRMEEQMTTNDNGGKQHLEKFRMQAIPPEALLALGRIRWEGHELYGFEDENYKLIPIEENIGRAMLHLAKWLNGERTDDHLGHALCRIAFAVQQEQEKKETKHIIVHKLDGNTEIQEVENGRLD